MNLGFQKQHNYCTCGHTIFTPGKEKVTGQEQPCWHDGCWQISQEDPRQSSKNKRRTGHPEWGVEIVLSRKVGYKQDNQLNHGKKQKKKYVVTVINLMYIVAYHLSL